MARNDSNQTHPWVQTAGKVAALVAFAVILAWPLLTSQQVARADDVKAIQEAGASGLDVFGLPTHRLLAITVMMAILWMTQPIPISVTALLPVVLFPLFGIQSAKDVSQAYINSNIFLFLGGFIVALGIEKCGLHRRIALHIVRLIGTSPKTVVLGFMVATAFLSMWISNTASTLMMLPIGMALLASLRDIVTDNEEGRLALRSFAPVLMMSIAYAASIGGFTTLVGTPTNVQFTSIWHSQFPNEPELSAGQWMLCLLPAGILMLGCAWAVLCFRVPKLPGVDRIDRSFFGERLKELGKPSRAEWTMLVIFVSTALLWIFRKPLVIGDFTVSGGWGAWLTSTWGVPAGSVDDSTVAVGMAVLLFVLPAGRRDDGSTEYLMDWETANRLPWGILLLIGGGFALAGAFKATGLSEWIGAIAAQQMTGWSPVLVVASCCFMLTFLTEFTSNIATVSTVLPILGAAAVSMGIDPRLVMIPAAVSASCAFMLPIATPPNAIVFGSGEIRIGQMMKVGLVLNLIGVVVITAITFLVLVPRLGIAI